MNADNALLTMSTKPADDGVGAGKGSFDKFGVSGDGSQLFVLEEKGGGATVNSTGRVVEDGTRALECSRKSGHSLCCELVYMRVS
jgi:hypothetical protein